MVSPLPTVRRRTKTWMWPQPLVALMAAYEQFFIKNQSGIGLVVKEIGIYSELLKKKKNYGQFAREFPIGHNNKPQSYHKWDWNWVLLAHNRKMLWNGMEKELLKDFRAWIFARESIITSNNEVNQEWLISSAVQNFHTSSHALRATSSRRHTTLLTNLNLLKEEIGQKQIKDTKISVHPEFC